MFFILSLPVLEVSVPLSLFKCPEAVTILRRGMDVKKNFF